MKHGITVAYSGVHQAYQLALAAEELAQLDRFYCSLFVGRRWGKALGRLLGPEKLLSRRMEGLCESKVRENPWPLFAHHCRARLRPNSANDWLRTNDRFDQWVARRLRTSDSSIFVGVETCARDSFRIASERGIVKLLDCPQVHPGFLSRLFDAAAEDLELPAPQPFDSAELAARKAEEFEMADQIITISEVHRRSFLEGGFSEKRLIEIPLWVDPGLWFPPIVRRVADSSSPLKVLFVGSLSFRKGIPYLVRAVDACGDSVCLTIVGASNEEFGNVVDRPRPYVHCVGTRHKVKLRDTYWDSDVLILPSLVDTFGFVAMEAMACGLPVIVTENCGVPVPDSSWRVPIMDSDAIAERLTLYAEDRYLCREHGLIAAEFAREFTPERYRENVKKIFRELLGLPSLQ
jgi:glycosyltransferase involved in cell wall biosynthesis